MHDFMLSMCTVMVSASNSDSAAPYIIEMNSLTSLIAKALSLPTTQATSPGKHLEA